MENGDALYQKFKASKQAPVRLELALSGFFQPDGYTDKQHRDFGDYLRLDGCFRNRELYGLCHPESENTGVYLAAGTENPEVWVS